MQAEGSQGGQALASEKSGKANILTHSRSPHNEVTGLLQANQNRGRWQLCYGDFQAVRIGFLTVSRLSKPLSSTLAIRRKASSLGLFHRLGNSDLPWYIASPLRPSVCLSLDF